MVLVLRIIFTVLSALCLGTLIPVGAFFGWLYAMMCGFGAFLFFVLMLLCKQTMDAQQARQENRSTESAQTDSETSETEKKE